MQMRQFFITGQILQKSLCVSFEKEEDISRKSLINKIILISKIPKSNEYILLNSGKRVLKSQEDFQKIENNATIILFVGLRGGKGGFGTLMRNQATRRKKIQNWDASRNLQGKKIKYVNQEKLLLEYFRKKREEDKKVMQALQQMMIQKRTLQYCQGEVQIDQKLKQNLDIVEENVANSIKTGLKNQVRKQDLEDIEKENTQLKKIKTLQKKGKKSKQLDEPNSDKVGVKTQEKVQIVAEKEESKKQDQEEIKQQEKMEIQKKEQKIENKIVGEVEECKKNENESKQTPVIQKFDIDEIKSIEDLLKLGNDSLKFELQRLGLKCGGTLQEKAERLWAIKLDKRNLFLPKFIQKKKN